MTEISGRLVRPVLWTRGYTGESISFSGWVAALLLDHVVSLGRVPKGEIAVPIPYLIIFHPFHYNSLVGLTVFWTMLDKTDKDLYCFLCVFEANFAPTGAYYSSSHEWSLHFVNLSVPVMALSVLGFTIPFVEKVV